MIVFEPLEPHAPTGDDACCAAHDFEFGGYERWRDAAHDGPRLWEITGDKPVKALWVAPQAATGFADQLLHKPTTTLTLAPGTRLRLDALHSGRFYEGGDHILTFRRFCVLDGPWAGTCWAASETSYLDDNVPRSIDPVAPAP
jgi:hypothetical protein